MDPGQHLRLGHRRHDEPTHLLLRCLSRIQVERFLELERRHGLLNSCSHVGETAFSRVCMMHPLCKEAPMQRHETAMKIGDALEASQQGRREISWCGHCIRLQC